MDDPDSRERKPITITAPDAVEVPIKRWRPITSSKSRRELKYHRIQSKKKENGINILPSRGMYPLIPLIVT